VVVAPGGAYMALALETEGYRVARRLADAGVAAFVLKYRVDPTPREPEVFIAAITQRVQQGGLADPQAPWPHYPCEADACADGLAALRWVRQRGAAWGLDPARVGIMGFSAGGMLAMRVACQYPDAASRPGFVASVYGAMDRTMPLPADAPPLFLAAAADDALLAHMALPMMARWRAAGHPAELHLYERGGHGFGARAQGSSSDQWLSHFLHWLRCRGQLPQAATAASSP
jgi:acetyl esterase/lipase